ncbi:MAG: GreA/GreB family elongation factor [Mariprofundaceae bacterium]|nr:GreA/GreB family elongation factor [Mariprofundaceae bacterium]
MRIDKQHILNLMIEQLRADLKVCEDAVSIARDTATHSDALGSSRYETMGVEASYLAQGQGVRLLEVERSLAWFLQVKLTEPGGIIRLSSLVSLLDEQGDTQLLWLAADAGGMKIEEGCNTITVITPKSPLGRAMLGKQQGDSFETRIADRSRCFEIGEVW